MPSKPVRRTIPISLSEFVMPRNLPILGRGCVHPRLERECLLEVQNNAETLLDTLPPGVALSSLSLRPCETSQAPPLRASQPPSQPPSSLAVLAGGPVVTARVRNTTRCEVQRFGAARSSTISAAASSALTQWAKQSRPGALVLCGTTQSPHQQTFFVDGRDSPLFEEGFCLNEGGETSSSFYSNTDELSSLMFFYFCVNLLIKPICLRAYDL